MVNFTLIQILDQPRTASIAAMEADRKVDADQTYIRASDLNFHS
jgi:hypothetical protein